jgi:hypothetical protein
VEEKAAKIVDVWGQQMKQQELVQIFTRDRTAGQLLQGH